MSEWIVKTIGELCDIGNGKVQTGPFGSQLHQSDYQLEGYPFVMPKDILNGKIDETSIARVSINHVERLSKHKLSLGDIIYGRRGDIGRQALVREENVGWLCGSGCLRISLGTDSIIGFVPTERSVCVEYIKYSIDCLKTLMQSISQGTTQDNFSQAKLETFDFLVPTQEVMDQFTKTSAPVFSQIKNLLFINKKLKQTRDRLLTRLISGKLSVEDLDIQFPPSMSAAAVVIQNQP
jgi:restriction endonuclease S subunit